MELNQHSLGPLLFLQGGRKQNEDALALEIRQKPRDREEELFLPISLWRCTCVLGPLPLYVVDRLWSIHWREGEHVRVRVYHVYAECASIGPADGASRKAVVLFFWLLWLLPTPLLVRFRFFRQTFGCLSESSLPAGVQDRRGRQD